MSDGSRDGSRDRERRQPSASQPYPSTSAPASGAWPAHPGAPYQRGMSDPMGTQPASAIAGPSGYSMPPGAQHGSRYEAAGGRPGGSGDRRSAGGSDSIRHRRIPSAELLDTRPKTLVSKIGKDGRLVKLRANYFKLLATTDWCLYKYRVDFKPEEERTIVKKGMLRQHRPTIGPYIFDGTVLYTSRRLPQPMVFQSLRRSDQGEIEITVRFVDVMERGDENYLQFFNIIMRKCLEYLELQLVGRNYFDARNKLRP